MRLALVDKDGLVVNVIEAEADFDAGDLLRTVPVDASVSPGWCLEGEAFSAPDMARTTPEKVSDLQFRLALNALGLREAAEDIVKSGSQGLRDYWDRALEIHRDHPFVAEAAQALAKSDAEIDQLFQLADGL